MCVYTIKCVCVFDCFRKHDLTELGKVPQNSKQENHIVPSFLGGKMYNVNNLQNVYSLLLQNVLFFLFILSQYYRKVATFRWPGLSMCFLGKIRIVGSN